MSSEMYEKMRNNPKFNELVSKRTRFATVLSVIVLTLFYGFVLVVAFAKESLASRIGGPDSVYTVGVAFVFFMFVSFWALVAYYVKRANTEFDALTAEVIAAAKEQS